MSNRRLCRVLGATLLPLLLSYPAFSCPQPRLMSIARSHPSPEDFLGASGVRGFNARLTSRIRLQRILVQYIEYTWWLARWKDNEAVCSIAVEHDGRPSSYEVLRIRGEETHAAWVETKACDRTDEEADLGLCSGLYLHLVATKEREKFVEVKLAPASVIIALEGCTPSRPGDACPELPALRFLANEPLPNEEITWVHVRRSRSGSRLPWGGVHAEPHDDYPGRSGSEVLGRLKLRGFERDLHRPGASCSRPPSG